MSLWALSAVAVLVAAWSLVSGRVERLDVTGPIVFVIAGLVLCNGPIAPLHVSVGTSAIHELAEVTLVLLLFADAARVDPADLRRHAGLPLRLLAVGLPLTLVVGFGVAAVLFGDLPWQLAALLAAALAPTDAALSASVVSDESLPTLIRRSLNVESGLNDGIATPVVTALIAAAAVAIGAGEFADSASGPGWSAAVDLVGGLAIGVGLGYLGGRAIVGAAARGWVVQGGRRIATLMIPVVAFAVSRELGVNYFVAAFVAGVAYRAAQRADDPETVELPELLGQVLSLLVWFVVGAVLLVDGLVAAGWRSVVYAVLSLTVVRMVPVAIAMVGSRSGRATPLFVGWFGPRGLASVVFGLLILEELPPDDPGVRTVTATIVLTVLASVVAHGVSGRPLTAWMASQPAPEGRPARPHRFRVRRGL
jgi:NhaP-type Na+/H+ or K+/H+ antiporter